MIPCYFHAKADFLINWEHFGDFEQFVALMKDIEAKQIEQDTDYWVKARKVRIEDQADDDFEKAVIASLEVKQELDDNNEPIEPVDDYEHNDEDYVVDDHQEGQKLRDAEEEESEEEHVMYQGDDKVYDDESKQAQDSLYGEKGYGKKGYDNFTEGYGEKGYGKKGYGKRGYDTEGYGKKDYDIEGYGKKGHDKFDNHNKAHNHYGPASSSGTDWRDHEFATRPWRRD